MDSVHLTIATSSGDEAWYVMEPSSFCTGVTYSAYTVSRMRLKSIPLLHAHYGKQQGLEPHPSREMICLVDHAHSVPPYLRRTSPVSYLRHSNFSTVSSTTLIRTDLLLPDRLKRQSLFDVRSRPWHPIRMTLYPCAISSSPSLPERNLSEGAGRQS